MTENNPNVKKTQCIKQTWCTKIWKKIKNVHDKKKEKKVSIKIKKKTCQDLTKKYDSFQWIFLFSQTSMKYNMLKDFFSEFRACFFVIF